MEAPAVLRLQVPHALLGVASTGAKVPHRDHTMCCHQPSLPSPLLHCSLSDSDVTTAGVHALCASHPGRLGRLQLDGCRVAMSAILHALRCQRRGVVLWSPSRRGYLPRWVNLANTLLMVAPAGQRQRLRLRHAPEACWPAQAGMAAVVAAVLLGHAGLLLLTTALLLLLPLAGLFLGAALLAAMACGRRPASSVVVGAASRGEVYLSAVLVGVLAVRAPPPPPPADHLV